MADVTSPFGFPYPENNDLVRDGAQAIENLATDVNDYLAGGYLYAGTIYYTSSGTFLKADPLGTGDIGLRAIRVRVVGAGGGGGGIAATGATEASQSVGGGGGGYAESFITDIAGLDTSVTVTRGAGGTAGAAGANAGGAGGSSSFGALVVASGGSAGGAGSATSTFPAFQDNTNPGTGTAGTILGSGGASIPGTLGAGAAAGSNIARAASGYSFYSGGRRSVFGANGDNGVNGSGGGPVLNIANGTAKAGGTGGNGVVIVDVFV